jgi:hypothetical protein
VNESTTVSTTDTDVNESTTTESTTDTDVTTESTTETETTTTIHVPEGAIIWDGDEAVGNPGDTVTVKLIVKNPNGADVPVSGAKFAVDTPTGFNIVDASGSDAYSADLTESGIGYKFTTNDGSAINAADGSVVAEFQIKIPENAKAGDYTVDFTDVRVNGDAGINVTNYVIVLPGNIKVIPKPVDKTTYAVLDTTYGFYFSHDNGKTTGRGFSTDMVKSIKIIDVVDGIETEREIDRSLINFGGATPANVFNASAITGKSLDEFKYEIPVYYGEDPLLDKDGNQCTVTAYIGVKGDSDLDGMVLMFDASSTLKYFTAMSSGKQARETLFSDSKLVSGPDDILDDFCAFLANVTADEYDPDNWSKTKENRTFRADDASAILRYYTRMSTLTALGEVDDDTKQAEWDTICPDRAKSKA